MTYSILQTYQHDAFSSSELQQTDNNITFLMRILYVGLIHCYCVYQTNLSSGALSLLLFRRVHKIQKATISFNHVRLSVRMEQLGSLWTDLYEIWYSSAFRKSVEIIQVSFNLSRKTGTLHEDQFTYFIYLAEFFLE
jgi:hypothetical protein